MFLAKAWGEEPNIGHRVSDSNCFLFIPKKSILILILYPCIWNFLPDITNIHNHFLTHIIHPPNYHKLLEGVRFRGWEYSLCIQAALSLNKFRQVTSPLCLIFLIYKNGADKNTLFRELEDKSFHILTFLKLKSVLQLLLGQREVKFWRSSHIPAERIFYPPLTRCQDQAMQIFFADSSGWWIYFRLSWGRGPSFMWRPPTLWLCSWRRLRCDNYLREQRWANAWIEPQTVHSAKKALTTGNYHCCTINIHLSLNRSTS